MSSLGNCAPNRASTLSVGLDTHPGFSGDISTRAFRAEDGKLLWADRYDGGRDDSACCLAISPDGSTVYVEGRVRGRREYSDTFGTLAYDAASGTVRWTARFPAGFAFPSDIAVSPSGELVHVTGRGQQPASNSTYATVTFEAASGMEVWHASFNGADHVPSDARAMALGPDGTVYVTGRSGTFDYVGDPEIATVAYAPLTGVARWVSTYNEPPGGSAFGVSIAVAPSGSHVFVTGRSAKVPDSREEDFLTLALQT